jgi:hypothetical protein
MKSLVVVALLFAMSSWVQAGKDLAIGSFDILNKQWFVVSLSQYDANNPVIPHTGTRLELKTAAEDISPFRFRQLWQDALAVNESADIWTEYATDFDTFFHIIQEPLLKGDRIELQQDEDSVAVVINHYEHARLSRGFLTMVLQSLTARISPVPALKQGLLAQLPEDEQKRLAKQLEDGDVSLQRIGETSRWMRFPKSRVSQL